jgi:drug/metabolite transporter (DMT)-like permease
MSAILLYLCIIAAASTHTSMNKMFIRQSEQSAVFNALRALTAFAMFCIISLPGFTFHLPTMGFGMCYGIFLSISMYMGYRALCVGPMALTSMMVSFSVIFPVLWGILIRKEPITLLHCAAFLLLAMALILVNADKFRTKQKTDIEYKKWFLSVTMTCLCNGGCSILQKEHQTLFPSLYSREFMAAAMGICTLIFMTAAIRRVSLQTFRETTGKRYAVLAGITNPTANFLTLLLAGMENASVLFPMISAGTIFAALLWGVFAFREKPKANQYAALLAGVSSIILLKL